MIAMRVDVARLVAVWLIVAVAVSAVMTCVPGVMHAEAMHMPSCAAMADHQPGMSADVAMDCCAHHVPSLTPAKLEVLTAPVQSPTPRFASIVRLVAPPKLSLESGAAPLDLISPVSPPAYIVLSTLRV
jgi:hypothetical protein